MQLRPMVRSAFLAGYAQMASSLGVEPVRLARSVDLDPTALENPDIAIPAHKAYRLLELTAAITGVQDLGLRLSNQRAQLSYLGALGALLRDEADVRAALRRLSQDMSLHSTCLSLDLTEARNVAVLRLDIQADGELLLRQSTECAVGGLNFLFRRLIGPKWQATSVHFVHRCAGSVRPHRALFGCPVHFSSDFNAIVLSSHDLDQAIPMSDSGLRRYAPLVVHAALEDPARLAAGRTMQSMLRLLPESGCNATKVAGDQGISRRTLHRHLAEADATFSELLHNTRANLAFHYLAAGTLAMTEIADLLGFGSASAFSRWFRTRTGVSPSRWKLKQQQVARPDPVGVEAAVPGPRH